MPYLSLNDRVTKITSSYHTQEKIHQNKTKLFANLKKADFIDEIHERNLNFSSTTTIKELKEILTDEIHGIQRLPALLFGNSNYECEGCYKTKLLPTQ